MEQRRNSGKKNTVSTRLFSVTMLVSHLRGRISKLSLFHLKQKKIPLTLSSLSCLLLGVLSCYDEA